MNTRGYSLIELMVALSLTTILLAATVPHAARARSVLSVRGARSDIASLAALTRSTAIMTGGATLVIDVEAGSMWIETPGGQTVGGVDHVGARHGVRLEATRDTIRIRYDMLGIGRLGNATLRVHSGPITGTITVSAFGRVRTS